MFQPAQPSTQSKFNKCHDDEVIQKLPICADQGHLHVAQVQALLGLNEHFADQNKPNIALVVLPTGAGKSGVAILTPYVLNSSRVLIITPSVSISTQLHRDMCGYVPENTFFFRRGLCESKIVHYFTENGLLIDKSLLKKGTIDSMESVVHKIKQHNLMIANVHKFGNNTGFDLKSLPSDIFDTVIVDEAHHYPAKTWQTIIDHFVDNKNIFLTATPYHSGNQIVGNDFNDQQINYTAYSLSRQDAVNARLIRPLQFIELGNETDSDEQRIQTVADGMVQRLEEHDEQDPSFPHQAMIICYTVEEVNQVVSIINNKSILAVAYHRDSGNEEFQQFCRPASGNETTDRRNERPRFLVSCGKASEGFNHPDISVVGILRNIAPTSSVLFSQFVGRSVRIKGSNDNVTATIFSHVSHNQKDNYENLDNLAEEDPMEDL